MFFFLIKKNVNVCAQTSVSDSAYAMQSDAVIVTNALLSVLAQFFSAGSLHVPNYENNEFT